LMSNIIVSVITTSMTELQIVTAGEASRFSHLRHFLSDNAITSELAMRVQHNAKFVVDEQKRNIHESQVDLLAQISPALRVELHLEMHLPILSVHPFFAAYANANRPAMGYVCHNALSHMVLHKGDIVFSFGERPIDPKMYLVVAGHLFYTVGANLLGAVTKGQWASEPALWTTWSHYGQLQAEQTVRMTTVSAKVFQQVATQFQTIDGWPQRYAQAFVREMNLSQACRHRMDRHDSADTFLSPQPTNINKAPRADLSDLSNPDLVDVHLLAASVFNDINYEDAMEKKRSEKHQRKHRGSKREGSLRAGTQDSLVSVGRKLRIFNS